MVQCFFHPGSQTPDLESLAWRLWPNSTETSKDVVKTGAGLDTQIRGEKTEGFRKGASIFSIVNLNNYKRSQRPKHSSLHCMDFNWFGCYALSVSGWACLHTFVIILSSSTQALTKGSYGEDVRLLLFCGSEGEAFSRVERGIVGWGTGMYCNERVREQADV